MMMWEIGGHWKLAVEMALADERVPNALLYKDAQPTYVMPSSEPPTEAATTEQQLDEARAEEVAAAIELEEETIEKQILDKSLPPI